MFTGLGRVKGGRGWWQWCWDWPWWAWLLGIASNLLLWYGYPRIPSGWSMKCVRARISHPGTPRMASGWHPVNTVVHRSAHWEIIHKSVNSLMAFEMFGQTKPLRNQRHAGQARGEARGGCLPQHRTTKNIRSLFSPRTNNRWDPTWVGVEFEVGLG